MSQATAKLIETMQRLSKPALKRLLDNGGHGTEFYNEEEEAELAKALGGVWGTSNLFGRARIRLRADEAERRQGASRFSDESTSFAMFGDDPLPVLKPLDAIQYFMRLVPSLGIDPVRFGAMLERHAFTLAVATNERMLDRVQQIIGNQMETGEAIGYGKTGTAGAVNAILDEAGVTPRNPQYGEMVARTNVMDGLTTGSQREQLRVRDTFPAWKYSAITKDKRGRKWHSARNGMVFSVDIPFAKVRGEDIGDVANCVLPGMIAEGSVQAASKAWYTGKVAYLRTVTGQRIALTIQHPILTNRGWIQAGKLKQGDYLASNSSDGHQPGSPTGDYVQHDPACIDQIFDTLHQASAVAVKRSTTFDFYGDGRYFDGKIEIVRADSFLRNSSYAQGSQRKSKFLFTSSGQPSGVHVVNGASDFGGESVTLTTSRFMSRRNLLGTIALAHLLPLQCLGLGLGADRNVSGNQTTTNGSPVNTILFGNPVFAHPGRVVFDQVADISIGQYSGHVYDLQTTTGMFAISDRTTHNGIIIKNCRCVPIPVDKWDLEEYLKAGGALATSWPVKGDYE